MAKINSVAIYKQGEVSVFEVGGFLIKNGEKTTVQVLGVEIGFFGKIIVSLSDGAKLTFKGFPYSYDSK